MAANARMTWKAPDYNAPFLAAPARHMPVVRRKCVFAVLMFGSVLLIDILASLVLFLSLHRWHIHLTGWSQLRLFRSDSLDLLLLSLLRLVILCCLTALAIRTPTRKHAPPPLLPVTNGRTNGGLSEPLLGGVAKHGSSASGSSGSGAAASIKDMDQPPAVISEVQKNIILLFGFILCTLFQMYAGIKCVTFDFQWERLQGLLMGLTVLWINLESLLLSHLVNHVQLLKMMRAKVSVLPKDPSSPSVSNAGAPKPGVSKVEGQLRGDKGARTEADINSRQYLFRAIALARKEWHLVLLGSVCLLLTSATGLVLPKYQGGILDRVIKMDRPGFTHDVLVLLTFSAASGIFGGIRGLCFSLAGKRILKTLQTRLFQGVIIQDIAYFDATTSGEITSRLTNDVSAMAEPCSWMLSFMLRNLLSMAGGLLLCFHTSWKLSMLAFTTMAPVMHITSVYSRWSRGINRERQAILAEANSVASEALGNIRTVRAFSTEETEIAKFDEKTENALKKGIIDSVAYSGALAINNWLDLGAGVVILWYGGMLVMDHHLSIGRLITFQLYWSMIQDGYQSFMGVLMSLTRASGAAQRVLTLIDALPDIDPFAGTKLAHVDGELQFKDVHFVYQMRPDQPVLRGVNLQIAAGQVCAFVGRSGNGKSTLVHLVMRFYDPTSGSIELDGMDLRRINLRSLHKFTGLVAQDTQMFATTIEGNISYGIEKEVTTEEVVEAAKKANAHDFILAFPDGYKTRVGERGVRISGGQRQRIAIARMLLRRPRVLLLDEATSALDTESEHLVQGAIDTLIKEGGRTVLLVAHRLSTVQNADVIAVVEQGQLVEKGKHEALVTADGVYARLVRRQLAKAELGISEAD